MSKLKTLGGWVLSGLVFIGLLLTWPIWVIGLIIFVVNYDD